jgi:Trypsin-like peptidase domain
VKVSGGIEQLYFVTAFLAGHGTRDETGEAVDWTGTGFIFGVMTNQGQANFLVSNKHVFDGAEGVTASSLDVRLIAAEADGQPALGQGTGVRIKRQPGDVTGHTEDAVDVGVIPFQFIQDAMNENGADPFFRAIGGDIVLSEDKLPEQVSALEDIVFVGYPSGIYDTANLTPVARRGITATPIALDYQDKPAFLIDGAVFGGSSGSPVFLYGPAPQEEGGPITIGPANRLMFAGILASVHVRESVGKIVELPTALAAISTEHLGLGIVYKPWAIDACIDRRLKEAGLMRETGGASAEESGSTADRELAENIPAAE